MKIASRIDFLSGAFIAAFGAAAVALSRQYRLGTASQMGPGYFPLVLGIGMVLLGAYISLRALARPGPERRPFGGRQLFWILASVLAFAWLLNVAGLLVAGFVLVVAARAASRDFHWREVALLAIGLSAFAVLVFGYGLGIPFQILPFQTSF